jgi:fatty-acyl-CoA synthase
LESQNPFAVGLDQNTANFVPLSPLSFIARTAFVYPKRISAIQGERQYTWLETYTRCRQLASALKGRGIGKGDTVAAMLPNVAQMLEAHFGVPMAGAVLNTLNTRLDAEALAFMLDHGEAKVLLTDPEFSGVIEQALEKMTKPKPLVIDVLDPDYKEGKTLGAKDYESFIAEGDPEFTWNLPANEWDPIALNYTRRERRVIPKVWFITTGGLT